MKTAAMTSSSTRTVPRSSWACSETNGRCCCVALMSWTWRAVEPHLPQWDVRVAQSVDLHAPHVRLEQPLVGVVEARNQRDVVENQLLGAAVQIDTSAHILLRPRLNQEIVHDRVSVPREVAWTLRVEELEEEVVGVRYIREPRVQEHRELALGKRRGERRPV